MKVGDIIKVDKKSKKQIYSTEGENFRLGMFNGRVVKNIRDNYLLLQGDSSLWFQISDFENEPQYEIY